MSTNDERYDRLIDLIYASAVGEIDWQSFLLELSSALPDGQSTLFYHDVQSGRGSVELNSGVPPDVTRQYAAYYSRLNPWMPKAAIRPVGIGVVGEQMCEAADFQRSEFYNDFARHIGVHSAIGLTIFREKGRSLLLSTLTTRMDPNLNVVAANEFTRLAPHLLRAYKFAQRRLAASLEQTAPLFDAIEVGFLAIDDGRRLKAASGAADDLVKRGEDIRIGPTGLVRLQHDRADELLGQMLAKTYAGPKQAQFIAGTCRLTLMRVMHSSISWIFDGPTVVILVEALARGTQANARIYKRELRITPSEERALDGIMGGLDNAEIARNGGVSTETVRTQIKTLFSKAGVNSRTELLRLLAGL